PLRKKSLRRMMDPRVKPAGDACGCRMLNQAHGEYALDDLAVANRAHRQTLRRHRRVPLFLPAGRARESYRLPSASISPVPINSLRPVKSSMRERNGSEVPPAASEAEYFLALRATSRPMPPGNITRPK